VVYSERGEPDLNNVNESLGSQETDSQAKWRGVKEAAREIIETAFLTLVIFLLIRTVVQNFRIEGYSMEPNLHDGQYLIVNKLIYRKIGDKFLFHPPQRGDIIVFKYPRVPDRDFIKRVIGLPGETVEIRQGHLFINGELVEEPYISNSGTYSWGPAQVGEDEFFVLGDNRRSSSDSHTWGMLPRENIIGKAWISYWPPRYWGLLPHHSFAAEE